MKPTMTMEELRDYANENNLFYSHVFGTKGTVYIYEDRYRYKRIGTVEVTDYRPIKNYRCMKKANDYQILEIVRKRIRFTGKWFVMSVGEPDEIERIRIWLKEGEK